MKDAFVSTFENVIGIVLAAGQGKRMNSSLPKVAHLLCEKPLVIWVLESLIQAGVKKIILVISHLHEEKICKIIKTANLDPSAQIHFSYQDQPQGTGHAVQCGIQGIQSHFYQKELQQKVLIAYGDTPAIKSKTFAQLIQLHEQDENAFTVLAFEAKNPFGYGRVITDAQNQFLAIREEKDCNDQEKKLNLCNSGIVCGNFKEFEELLPQLENKNAQSEYYLTDVPVLAKNRGDKIGVMTGKEEHEFLGVNSQQQLLELEKSLCAE